jgi:predicted translin family RNA/ssDNA-binding protein
MASKKIHPSVQKFKEFVREHPKLVQEVRKGNREWQEVFEDWYLLGENDVVWKQYKDDQSDGQGDDEEKKSDFMAQMLSAVKKMDMDTVNNHISNMSSTISTIQGLFDQFGLSKGGSQNSSGKSQHPFSFRKD